MARKKTTGKGNGKGKNTRALVLSVAAAPSSDPLVREAIVEINRIWGTGLRDTVVRVGQYLIKNFYGSIENARSLSPDKAASLASLYDRAEELALGVHQLRIAVRVAVQVRELPRPVAEALTATHHEKLLVVRDPKLREQLAGETARRNWTSETLEARIRQLQPPRAGGRPPLPPLERGVQAVIRSLTAQEIADGLTATALRALDREQVEALDIKVRRARDLLEQIADGVARRLRD